MFATGHVRVCSDDLLLVRPATGTPYGRKSVSTPLPTVLRWTKLWQRRYICPNLPSKTIVCISR